MKHFAQFLTIDPVVTLKFAAVELFDWGCTSHFLDGTSYDATPHPWNHHYNIIAHRCGYGDDVMAYCVEHEIAHHVVEEFLHNRPSRILWGLAHGEPLSGPESAYEELMAQTLQRFARASERPIIGDVNWDAMRARFMEVLPCSV